jgi:murein DD-endopeptidase MepM/ murein hydrolase activator NlpD
MGLRLTVRRDRTGMATCVSVVLSFAMVSAVISLVTLVPRVPDEAWMTGMTPARPVPELPPAWPMSLAAHAIREVEGEFRNGDTFSSVLTSAGVAPQLIDELARATHGDFDVQKIRAGRPYKIYFGPHDELLLFRYGREGWRAEDVVVPYTIRPRFVHAAIRGSLEGAIAATWVSRADAINLAQKLAEIFAWDIDFAADLRVEDALDVLVEQRFLEGEFVGFGDVLAASLKVNGRTYEAVRFARAGGSTAYFRPGGESLQRAFLRSPVNYSRISSRFTYRRLHPVLNVVRPHRGVDYVAPLGTPVHATAAGTIVYAGRNGQAGNHVRIRHGGSYNSGYLHLQRFAPGLKVGDAVEQNQVIGYVGATGLATSAHLHYELERGGERVDPLEIDFPAAAPLPPEHRAQFDRQRDRWIMLLRQGQLDRPVVLAGSE